MWQDDNREVRRGSSHPDLGGRALRGSRARREAGRRRPTGDTDGVPGPVLIAQPAHDRPSRAQRTAEGAPARPALGHRGTLPGAHGARRPPTRSAGRPAEPILRGPATADRDRPGAHGRAARHHRGRACLRSGRLSASHDPAALRRPAQPPWPHRRVHLAQPGRRAAPERLRRSHVPGADRGAGQSRISLQRSASSLHPRVAGSRATPATDRPGPAHGQRRTTEPDRHPDGLLVPSPLPALRGNVHLRQTASRAGWHRRASTPLPATSATRHLPALWSHRDQPVAGPAAHPARSLRTSRAGRRFPAPDSSRRRAAPGRGAPSARSSSAAGLARPASPRSTSTRSLTVPRSGTGLAKREQR